MREVGALSPSSSPRTNDTVFNFGVMSGIVQTIATISNALALSPNPSPRAVSPTKTQDSSQLSDTDLKLEYTKAKKAYENALDKCHRLSINKLSPEYLAAAKERDKLADEWNDLNIELTRRIHKARPSRAHSLSVPPSPESTVVAPGGPPRSPRP